MSSGASLQRGASTGIMDFELKQSNQLPPESTLDRFSCVVLVLPAASSGWENGIPYGTLLARRYREQANSDPQRLLVTDLPNARGTRVALCFIPPELGQFQRLGLARKLIAAQVERRPGTLALLLAGYQRSAGLLQAEALIAAALAAAADLPQFKREPAPPPPWRSLQLYGITAKDRFQRSFAEAQGNALARGLSILPPNQLTPGEYLRRVRQLARDYGWQLNFLSRRELRRRGAGAFLAVTQGGPGPGGIVHLQYSPQRPRRGAGRIALVGKGVCYDTGGVNLKPARYMYGMHEDMQGSSVALGTLLALSRLNYRQPVDCWLALATNLIGPEAYCPNDVVRALNGDTIEVVHTDAEGRMLLADTLTLASRTRGVSLLIDYATLTGACVGALGSAYSGVFSNRESCLPRLVEVGRRSGERVWPFPLDADYEQRLQSRIADVKQCSQEGECDHILAACFLKRFIERDVPWLHLDLSSSHHRGGLAHIPTDTTGFGVRFSLHLLLDHKLSDLLGEPRAA